jgi:predicted permease
MADLKLALRTLFKAPLVTVVAIVSLALGIGATSAIFSLFNQVLLRPLPVAEPAGLVNLASPGPKPGSSSCNNAGGCDQVFSYPMFRDLQGGQTVFSGVAAHRSFGANLAYRGQTLSGEGMLVSGSYFPVLGVQPALGRLLGPHDDRAPGESPVVVLSHTYWRTRFEASHAVLDDTLIVNGRPMTIIGVAPRGFEGTTLGIRPQVFVPITMREAMEPYFGGAFDNRRAYWVYLFARLGPGVSIEEARAAVNVPYRAILNEVEAPLQEGMSDQTMARFRAKEVTLEAGMRGQSSTHGEARAPLLLLLGVTAIVLLSACANIANLLLVRSVARSGEMAIRLSIGASRGQLVRQLLVESCVLAALGGIGGLLVAPWTLAAIGALLPAEVAALFTFQLDTRVLLFAAVLTLGTGLLFGLFPALHATRPDVLPALKGQAGQPAGARSASRFRASLATVQIGLSMALLVSAGLFTKSLLNVTRVDLGIRTDNLVTFGVSPLLNGYGPEQSEAFFARLEAELGAIPGVTGVTASVVPLLAGSNWGSSVRVQGFESGPDTDSSASFNQIGDGYFRALGVPLLAGREFTAADASTGPKVAIVNEQFAKKFNLGREAVGKRMASGRGTELDTEIVGLVRNTKYSEVKGETPPLFFRPYRQGEPTMGFMSFYVRSSLDPAQLLATIPQVVARLDPNLPLEELKTMDMQIRQNVFLDRLIGVLSAAFALLATLLAAVGLYGVLAYTVAQRTREFGLRMALGAAPGNVRAMVLRQVGRMTLIGGAAGVGVALAMGHAARSLLYELQGTDPAVLGTAVVLLIAVALGAGVLPAQRASRVDPMRALRYE